MELLPVGPVGAESPAVLIDDRAYIDVSAVVGRFDGDFFVLTELMTLSRSTTPRGAG